MRFWSSRWRCGGRDDPLVLDGAPDAFMSEVARRVAPPEFEDDEGTAVSNLTNILYLIGSLCFLAGSIANFVR